MDTKGASWQLPSRRSGSFPAWEGFKGTSGKVPLGWLRGYLWESFRGTSGRAYDPKLHTVKQSKQDIK